MTKTIEEAFRILRSNLEITGLQEQTVSKRQTAIRDVLAADFKVLDSFLTGSYRRSTMIAPLKEADVDIFIVLDPSYYAVGGHEHLLNKVRTSLRKTYTRTPEIRPDGHAVTITFTDFKVDVVPGFYRKGGGYLIPDTQKSRWIETDPKKHVELWTRANKDHGGNLVPLIKMLKGWNKSRNLFRSFHLETLTLDILQNVTISDFPSAIRYVFDKARNRIALPLSDPAGYAADIAEHVNTAEQIAVIVKRLEWAHDRAREAEKLTADGKISAAIDSWKLLLPGYFPAYG